MPKVLPPQWQNKAIGILPGTELSEKRKQPAVKKPFPAAVKKPFPARYGRSYAEKKQTDDNRLFGTGRILLSCSLFISDAQNICDELFCSGKRFGFPVGLVVQRNR